MSLAPVTMMPLQLDAAVGLNSIPAGLPVVVDLDGTLTPVDTLFEGLIELARKQPAALLGAAMALCRGRSELKFFVFDRVTLQPGTLPWRDEVVAYVRQLKAAGHPVILATAADEKVATAVAKHLGVFDGVIASSPGHNLKSEAKLAAIRERVGARFAYLGDSSADIPIWKAAEAAVLVGLSPKLAAAVRGTSHVVREFSADGANVRTWLRGIRWHQWSKNLLLFVPLVTAAGSLTSAAPFSAVAAFVAFCLAASATYIGNDLWDLPSDRVHPRKSKRPFASGQIPVVQAVGVAITMLALAFFIALQVSKGFAFALLAYFVITCSYSWVLKTYVLIDVLVLAVLYTLRVIAGAIAVGAPVSHWLLIFSTFVFLSLALVKRCSELVSQAASGKASASGRDYGTNDLIVLWPLGVGAGLCAVVIFCLFIDAPATQSRYATPQALWFIALGLTYWLSRLWVKTARGEMHDDPIVYAFRDRGSRVVVLAMGAALVAAHIPWSRYL